MGFTAEQQRAIDARTDNLLVAAAAGSGKTAVLVERIIKLITSTEPLDIERLLVVTFTDAAAAEMRGRISDRLHARALDATNDENLRRQLMLLPRAQISTIHKFCANIIRKYFHLTELDPGFKIADETEMRLLKSQVLDELFEERYDADDADAFLELVDYYGGGKTKDQGLHELVLQISGFISGFPWQERWLDRACEAYDIEDIAVSPWSAVIRAEIEHRLAAAAAATKYAIGLAANGADKYLDNLYADLNALEDLRLCADDLTCFYEQLQYFEFGRLNRFSAKDIFDSEIKERVQSIRDDEVKPIIKDLRKLFAKPIVDMASDIQDLQHIIKNLTTLTAEFISRYGEAKRKRNIADFNDLERFALNILLLPESNEKNPLLSDAARELREFYAEVMVDEYQDSNLVQELILSAVAGRSRFMVGDVKQSIYKFRGAKPELFLEKYNTYPESNLILLSKNFRSRECVVSAVNLIFGKLMSTESEIDYDENAKLYYGADYPEAENTANSAEVYIIDGASDDENDISRVELEAMAIAGRISELVGENPLHIYDRDTKTHRKATYKDIVILIRSRGVTETLLDILKRNGIPAFADEVTGYFDSIEVMTLLSFLQVVDNPLQDIPLLAALRSPVYGLTDDDLLEIRGTANMSFYDCVRHYSYGKDGGSILKNKLNKFLSDLEDFRRKTIYLPISGLIDYILTATDYFNLAGAMAGGAVRQANLRMLREKAVQYEETSFRGLFHFIAYMQRVRERVDEGSAKALSENANVVRIMTVHKSKGLEFPIVFVSMLGRGFSRQDERASVNLHSGLGIGTAHIDLEKRIKSNTLPRMAIANQLRRESLAEELRVLYVALTRAREKLILTGSVNDLAKSRERWERFKIEEKMPAHMVFNAGNYLDWLMPILHDSDIKLHYKDFSDIADAFIEADERDEERKTGIEKLSADCEPDIRASLEWSYPLKALAKLPAKLSISEIKRLHNRGQDSAAEAYIPVALNYSPPRFLQGETGPTPAGRGTVMHTVLEHMDMTFINESADLHRLVSNLVRRKILTAYEAGLVDYPALLIFCRSDIFRRILSAKNVQRETPFVLGLTPYQIYKNSDFQDIDANILVHGIIDCYFEENGKLILVDYKTGNVRQADIDDYSVQMSVYKLALERATGKEVAEVLLYLFAEGQAVQARLTTI